MANRTGTSKNDKLTGTAASDRLFGLAGNDLLIGLGGVDTLDGGAGNDTLDGGTGNDKLIGGTGNDTFIVTATSGTDVFVEAAGAAGGTDTVVSSRASFTLGANLENLVLLTPAVTGIGNSLNNVITGNSLANTLNGSTGNDTLNGGTGNDSLNGGVGNDSMSGGAGNDTYVVDVAGDKVFESGSGVDTVQSTVTFNLTAHVQIENLTLQGTGAINGTGNTLANTITGNSLANTLSGMGGADKLSGGAGNDTLVWDAADTLRDGGTGADTLLVSASGAVNLAAATVTGIEIVNLASTNTVTINSAKVLTMSDTDILRIDGGAGDVVNSTGEDWTLTGQETIGSATYNVYDSDLTTAVLKIQQGIDFNDLNHAPMTAGEDLTVSEDAASGTVADNTTDLDPGDTLTFSVDGATPAGLTLNTDGTYTFGAAFDSLDAGGSATVSFSYTAGDGQSVGDPSTVTLTVTGVNDAPVANDDSNSVNEDTSVSGSAAGNDSDADANETLTWTMSGTPTGLSFTSTGAYTFDAGAYDSLDQGQTLNVTAGYTLTDGDGETDGATLTITVTGVNDIPDAVNDTNSLNEDASVTGSVAGNDTDLDTNETLTWSVASTIAGLTFASNGAYAFDASAFDGLDQGATMSVTQGYTLTDGDGETSGATLTVTVTGVNDIPDAVNDTNSVNEDSSVTGSVATNDDDVDDTSSVSWTMSGTPTGLTFAGTGAYTFDAGAYDSLGEGETQSVTAGYTLTDEHGASDGATLTIAVTGVNDEPVAGDDANSVNEDASVTGTVATNDTDADTNETLTWSMSGTPTGLTFTGTGAYTFDAGAYDSLGEGETQSVTAGYTLTDEHGASDGATLTIAVTGQNDVPVNTVPGAQSTSLLDNLAIGGISVADADLGADDITIELSTNLGSLSLSELDGLAFTTGDGSFDPSMEFSGSLADVNAALASLVFHTTTQAGSGTITLASSDEDSGTDTDTIAVTVSANLQLSALDGTSGFELNGEFGAVNNGDYAGSSVSAAGDVNGDGYGDLLIGAPRRDTNGVFAGTSYVVFGKASGFASRLDLSALDGTNGFELNGEAGVDQSGISVSEAGDVNGDGYGDLLIGASGRDINGNSAGASYVVFGKASGFASRLDLSALDGTNGFELNGEAENDLSGQSVSAAGDVNGDGYGDLLIAAYGRDVNGTNAGASYVVFGKASGFASRLDLSALDGANGFELNGEAGDDRSGRSVSAAGDVNGDGYGDLLIGAFGRDVNATNAGASYVVFGKASGFASRLDLSALDGANGFELNGEAGNNFSGQSVSAAGDVNGDGYGDLLIGAPFRNGAAGASYVVFGKASGFSANLNLAALDGTNGFELNGEAGNDLSGVSVSAAGDVNGDGYDDVLIGAHGRDTNGNNAGASYLVFGKASGFSANVPLSALDGADGFELNGEFGATYNGDYAGYSVSAAGDVNGDGYGDLLIGAPRHDTNGLGAGASYVVFGRDFNGIVDFAGGAGNDTYTGAGSAEIIIGGGGNDTLTGAGGADVFRGGEGDDRIVIADTGFLDVDGGLGVDVAGLDTLAVSGELDLDLRTIADSKITGIEAIDLVAAGGANMLELDALELLNLSDTSNTLRVDGGAGDAVDTTGLWTDNGTAGGYREFQSGAAILRVQEGIDVSGITTPTVNIDLSALDGTSGFELNGETEEDRSGHSVSAAGDVNGDGYGDLLIGAVGRDVNGSNAGASYVVFGKASGFASRLDLSALNGTNGFELNGEFGVDLNGDYSGRSVSAAGDVNGDGYGDLLIGAQGRDTNGNNAGASYVVFGKAAGFASRLDLSALDGTSGFELNGEAEYDLSGHSVSAAGDVNGDGYSDLVIGANGRDVNANFAGATYVVFGSASGFGASLNLSALDGTNGFELNGEAGIDRSGYSVSAAGDVNGDGYGDLLIGAYGRDINGSSAGASYVVFGKASGFASRLDLSALDGTNGFELNGEFGDTSNGDYAGYSVSAAGDVNGDGYGDLLIGAYGRDTNGARAGASYVVFGKASGFASRLELSALDGANGFELNGEAEYDVSGRSVSAAGDVNGDGYGDLLIGASGRDVNYGNAGASYVVFGKASGFASRLDLSTLDGTSGFELNGEAAAIPGSGDYSGRSVSAAGDVNGDGYGDLLIGAPLRDTNGASAGASYVVFGGDFRAEADFAGGAGNDTYTGAGSAEIIIGGGGNDTLTGGGGADVFRGGEGDDRIVIADTSFRDVDGGGTAGDVTGRDTLAVSGELDLDLSTIADSKITGMEIIDLVAAGGANVLDLDALELLNLSDTSNTLRVDGGAGDAVDTTGLWTDNGTAGGYHEFQSGAAILRVQEGIDVSGIALLTVSIQLSSLDGANGIQLSGEAAGDASGRSVSAAGDVNGDGFEDLIVGAFFASPNGAASGASYVVFGGTGTYLDALHDVSGFDLTALDGTNGFQISGEAADDRSGISVSAAGDVNGDGYGDLIVGAYFADPNGADSGASYVVFGGTGAYLDILHDASGFDLSALDGTNGFQLSGAAGNRSGYSVSAAGDVNGDGYDDLIVGARLAAPNGAASGASYVVFGGTVAYLDALHDASGFDLSALDGTNGFQISGEAVSDNSGHSVSAAGDVNGDGYGDLIVGAFGADPNGSSSGASYVVFGGTGAYLDVLHGASGFDLSALDGTNGFQISGEAAGEQSGYSVSSGGDVNGDGFDDLIVGAFKADPNGADAGASYVVFGGTGAYLDALHGTSGFDLSALDGTNGFKLSGEAADDRSGFSVSAAGDVNGDGYGDLIVGALRADSNGADSGASYVVFGGTGAYLDALHGASGFNLSALDGTNGFELSGEAANDLSGVSVSAAGDLNGDGYDDLIVGARLAAPNGIASGASYVVFGRDFRVEAAFSGGAENDTYTGTGAAEIIIGGGDDDTLTGGGGADVFRGGEGDDRIVVGSSDFADLDGGSSRDTLALTGSFTLNLTTLADSRLTGIETIDLEAAGAATLTFDASEVLNLSDTSNTLRVLGGTGDVVNAGSGWAFDHEVEDGGTTYWQFTQGAAVLQVEADAAMTVDILADAIIGTSGGDELAGDGSNELIFGLAGADSLTGGPGNDTIHAGVDSDVDFINWGYGDGEDFIRAFVAGASSDQFRLVGDAADDFDDVTPDGLLTFGSDAGGADFGGIDEALLLTNGFLSLSDSEILDANMFAGGMHVTAAEAGTGIIVVHGTSDSAVWLYTEATGGALEPGDVDPTELTLIAVIDNATLDLLNGNVSFSVE